MAMWLYQMSQKPENDNPPTQYRLDVWEGVCWSWYTRRKKWTPDDPLPQRGDIVVFYYSGGGTEGGFCGWAVVLRWRDDSVEKRRLYFRPVSPSDILKMCPWNDEEAEELADRIRGANKQNTLYPVPEEIEGELRRGIISWASQGGT